MHQPISPPKGFARLKEIAWDVTAKIIMAVVFLSPGWGLYAYSTVKARNTQISTNKDGTIKNGKDIAVIRTELAAHEVEQRAQYEQMMAWRADMNILFGLATFSGGGNQLTASINVTSNAVRLRQGQELWVTNLTDDSEARIRVKVNGQFKAGSSYLLRLSSAARDAVMASKNEIQISVEPIGK